MSLTSTLDNPRSPVSRLVDCLGAVVAGTRRGGPFAAELQRLLAFDTLPRASTVPPVPAADAGTVGTAFDYRLRYRLAPFRSEDTVAMLGAAMLGAAGVTSPLAARAALRHGGTGSDLGDRLEWFFVNFDSLEDQLYPRRRGLLQSARGHLREDDERLLCRYCVVLAMFEAVFRGRHRAGWAPELPNLSHNRRTAPEDEPLLALAGEAETTDVMNLSRSAERIFDSVAKRVRYSKAYHPNPTFAGSQDVGGADADFIVASVIYELKTTRRPEPKALSDAMRQLLGYALLDYDDRYQIRRVGLYFPRQEWATEQPLWHILFPPATALSHFNLGTEPSEAEITDRLAKARHLMQRAAKGEEVDFAAVLS